MDPKNKSWDDGEKGGVFLGVIFVSNFALPENSIYLSTTSIDRSFNSKNIIRISPLCTIFKWFSQTWDK